MFAWVWIPVCLYDVLMTLWHVEIEHLCIEQMNTCEMSFEFCVVSQLYTCSLCGVVISFAQIMCVSSSVCMNCNRLFVLLACDRSQTCCSLGRAPAGKPSSVCFGVYVWHLSLFFCLLTRLLIRNCLNYSTSLRLHKQTQATSNCFSEWLGIVPRFLNVFFLLI